MGSDESAGNPPVLPPPPAMPVRPQGRRALLPAGLLLLVLPYVALTLCPANVHSLWLDEIWGLINNVRAQSYGDLVVHGPLSQGSPAPLSYLVDKVFDDVKSAVGYCGLTPFGYYRLASLIFTLVLGIMAVLILQTRFKRDDPARRWVQTVLALCGLACYLFHPMVIHYAVQDRPYALWSGLWLVILVCFLAGVERRWVLVSLLSLLSFTATAACYQILALAVARAVCKRAGGASWKDVVADAAILFSLPTAVVVYYILPLHQHGYEGPGAGTWPKFLQFWLVQRLPTWAIALATVYVAWKHPPPRTSCAAPLAALLLLMMAPLIYSLTRSSGFFFSPRQYIYYSAMAPIGLFLLALSVPRWPAEGRLWKKRAVVVAAALLVGIGFVGYSCRHSKSTFKMAFLRELLPPASAGRPRALSHPGEFDEVLHDNVVLAAEFLSWRHRDAMRGDRTVRLVLENRSVVVDPGPEASQPGSWVTIPLVAPPPGGTLPARKNPRMYPAPPDHE